MGYYPNLQRHLRDINRLEIRNYNRNSNLRPTIDCFPKICYSKSKKHSKNNPILAPNYQIIINTQPNNPLPYVKYHNKSVQSDNSKPVEKYYDTPKSSVENKVRGMANMLRSGKTSMKRQYNLRSLNRVRLDRTNSLVESVAERCNIKSMSDDFSLGVQSGINNDSLLNADLKHDDQTNLRSMIESNCTDLNAKSYLYMNLKGATKVDNFDGFQRLMLISSDQFCVKNILNESIFCEREKRGNLINMDLDNFIHLKEGNFLVNLSGNFRLLTERDLSGVMVGINLRFANTSDPDPVNLIEVKQIAESIAVKDFSNPPSLESSLKTMNFAVNKIFRNYMPKTFALYVLIKPISEFDINNILIELSRFDLAITEIV